jgi:ABC-type antimicrobial peptide transport system permease subunit
VLTGRALNDRDRGSSNSVLVSAALAETIAPNRSPLGRILFVADGDSFKPVEIVGVVADNRIRPLRAGDRPNPVIYTTFGENSIAAITITIGTPVVEAVSADLRSIVRDLDSRLSWLPIRRGDSAYLSEARDLQEVAFAVGGLGLLALALAAAGLYAVMRYVVLLRRREIGVRIAVGAAPRQILGMILRQALLLVVIGGAAGLMLAIPLSFGLRVAVVGPVMPVDPVAFAATFGLLLAAALVASIFPAYRAGRIDPIVTLRLD